MNTLQTDVLIVGSGIAGLYTALHLDTKLSCLVLNKESVTISNSWLAQGGIAAAVSEDDRPELHMEDTLVAGAGLCDAQAVRVLVDEAPAEIAHLRRLRVPFDLNTEGELAITREGGHNRNRVVHAGGDATGRETVKVLAALAGERANVRFLHNAFLVDLFTRDHTCCGALVWTGGQLMAISAGAVVLATGGAGQIYRRTTNPAVATGDGVAAAIRAGASLSGMEFVQFHPTALYDPSRPGAFLISEAVRGEGGRLVNADGFRFMAGRHPLGELAPRDIVARGIYHELRQSGAVCVYLDTTHLSEAFLSARFPTIFQECLRRGLHIAQSPIPVGPAQHYLVGGVRTDLWAETSIPGLFACGETACTGVHGANRLASNSMLECLVFGRRAAARIAESIGFTRMAQALPSLSPAPDVSPLANRIRDICELYAGVARTQAGLEQGLAQIRHILAELGHNFCGKTWWETRNMALVAQEVFKAALARKQSAGCHFIEQRKEVTPNGSHVH